MGLVRDEVSHEDWCFILTLFPNQYGRRFNLMIQLGFVTSVIQDAFLSVVFQNSCILTIFLINYTCCANEFSVICQ